MSKGIVTAIGKTVRHWFSAKGFPEFISITAMMLIFFVISTSIHELGHVISARMLNCSASISSIHLFTGATAVTEGCPTQSLVFVALGGPLLAFFVGLILWFSEPNGKERMLALVMFFLSSVLQLYPEYPLDMGQAIEWGLNPAVGWLIFLGVFAISFNLIWLEVKDEEMEHEE